MTLCGCLSLNDRLLGSTNCICQVKDSQTFSFRAARGTYENFQIFKTARSGQVSKVLCSQNPQPKACQFLGFFCQTNFRSKAFSLVPTNAQHITNETTASILLFRRNFISPHVFSQTKAVFGSALSPWKCLVSKRAASLSIFRERQT